MTDQHNSTASPSWETQPLFRESTLSYFPKDAAADLRKMGAFLFSLLLESGVVEHAEHLELEGIACDLAVVAEVLGGMRDYKQFKGMQGQLTEWAGRAAALVAEVLFKLDSLQKEVQS